MPKVAGRSYWWTGLVAAGVAFAGVAVVAHVRERRAVSRVRLRGDCVYVLV